MYILLGIIIFVILSLNAAANGDHSGIEAIGKFVLWAVLVFFMAWALTSGFWVVIAIIGIIALAASRG